MILWELEQYFNERLEDAKQSAMYDDLTIEELLNLGFNNNWLIVNNKKIELGWLERNGNFSNDLTKEQLNVKVYMKEDFGWYSDEDIDDDGYHIAKVYCRNKDDEELFKEMI